MCHIGGGKLCAARRGASNQVIFATIWRGNGRRSDMTLLSLFVRSQGRCLRAWWLCCNGCPDPFCGQPLLMSDLAGVGDFGRAFQGGRDRILLCWDLGRSRLGLDPGDTDGRGAGPGTSATASFLWASFPCSMDPLSGSAAWLGAGGAVRVSGRMFARALSFGWIALRRPRNDLPGAKETW